MNSPSASTAVSRSAIMSRARILSRTAIYSRSPAAPASGAPDYFGAFSRRLHPVLTCPAGKTKIGFNLRYNEGVNRQTKGMEFQLKQLVKQDFLSR